MDAEHANINTTFMIFYEMGMMAYFLLKSH